MAAKLNPEAEALSSRGLRLHQVGRWDDARRFVERLEAGYLRIYERSVAGLAPDHVVIDP